MDCGVVDEPLAEQDDRHERRTEQRDPDHSSSPRRIASATAAARSDTPSFSYSRA